MCFGGENYPVVLQPFSYGEILKHASNPRAKRQTTQDNILECAESIADVQCTSSFNLGLADTYAQCGRNDLATITANYCSSNEMRELCAAKISGGLNGLVSALTNCSTEIAPGSTTCSSACSTALQTLRNSFGCCINSLFNVTVVTGGFSITAAFTTFTPIFSSSLWEKCSVQTVGECPNVPSFTPGNRNPPCTVVEAFQAITTYQCTQTNIQPVLDALNRNSNCQFYTTILVNGCGQRSNGDLCVVDAIANPAPNLFGAVITNCSSFLTTQPCPGSSCTTAIEQFRNNSGCCVNNIFNSSIVAAASPGAALLTSIALWDACGVSSPGFCTSTLVGGSASTDKAFGVMLIAIAAAVVKFIF